MASKIEFVEAENEDRAYPNAFIIDEAMFKVNGVYVCVEPCGGGGGSATFLLGDQYVYISSDGDDTLDEEGLRGTELFPFLTIQGAMDYINSFITINGDIYLVFMDEGPFYVDSTVKINHPNKIIYSGIGSDIDPGPGPSPDGKWFGDTFVRMGSWTNLILESISIATGGVATAFGTMLTGHVDNFGENAAISDGITGVMAGGYDDNGTVKTMESFLFATGGATTYFGDTVGKMDYPQGSSNGTLGLIITGYDDDRGQIDTIESIDMAALANSTQWGTCTVIIELQAPMSNATVCVMAGGWQDSISTETSIMDIIEYATGGEATSFGSLIEAKDELGYCSNETYGYVIGGEKEVDSRSSDLIEQVDFASIGSTTFWGNLILPNEYMATASDGDDVGVVCAGYSRPGVSGISLDTIDTFTLAVFTITADWGSLAIDDGSWISGASGD